MAILDRAAIERRKDEIFACGTFSPKGLRAAAYDFRVRHDAELNTTGRVERGFLHLGKGQRAVLETYECISMPWDLAGNIGMKYRMGIEGLFVSPGLFVDPGFGWSKEDLESDPPSPEGGRLRFMVTNVGKKTISIRLGSDGDHVIGIQFLEVAESTPKVPIGPVDIDPQGLAFFEDLTEIEEDFGVVAKAAERTRSATELVVEFGVFLVALTTLGAIASFLLGILASGDAAANLVNALNDLDTSRPWTLAILVAILLIAIAILVYLSLGACALFRRIVNDRRPVWRRQYVP
jgi:deoxycytidine triphosphate deaminase